MSKIRKWSWASAVFGAVLVGFLVGAMPVGAETTRVDWMFSKDPSINGVEESSVVLQDSTDEGILGEPVELPILMYHNLVADQNDPQISQDSLWVGQFRQQMELLCQNGFHAVSLDQLLAFGETGAPLPEKPVLITFDDGYESVYTLAYPILQELNLKAVAFAVGVSVGQSTYKGTDIAITPHFTWEQAAEMAASGTISIQSHTYDMHQLKRIEEAAGLEGLRPNAQPRPGETAFSYANALWDDLQRFRQEAEVTGQPVTALAYPGGSWSRYSDKLLASYGVQCTFTTNFGKAVIHPGSQKDLYALNRFYITPSVTQETLLNWVK